MPTPPSASLPTAQPTTAAATTAQPTTAQPTRHPTPRPGSPRPVLRPDPRRPTRVAFLSDFGTSDEFVGVVHAVLDTHAPGVSIVDVTHSIPPHDVRAGALALWRAAPWLAPAVILGVVDPGVGTERRAVAIEVPAAATVLVGPDNGLLLPAALLLGPVTAAVELPPAPSAPGATFHGRDVFAPAAGRAAAGVSFHELGEPIDPATLAGEPVPRPTPDPTGGIEAEVLWVDHFGNAQLNATAATTATAAATAATTAATAATTAVATPIAAATPAQLTVHLPDSARAPGAHTMRVVPSYGAIPPDDYALVIDSYGFLSISCDRRPAAEHLGLRPGDRVRLRPADPDGRRD